MFIRASIFPIAALVFPLVVFAEAPRTFAALVSEIISILDAATVTLVILGVVIYLWGMSVNILKFEDDPDKRKAYFFWGIIVLFVMFSLWGIVAILGNTLFGEGQSYFSVTQGTGEGGGAQIEIIETPWSGVDVGP